MGDSLCALAGESMRDFNDLEWGCGMKVTFVVINIILLAITCVALGLPVYIMGTENNPYTFYFHNDKHWHWVPPQETKVITFVFAIYCTVFDVPLTAFRIIQTAFNCCKCRDCLTIPYGLTHLITPIMYAAVAIICTVNKWGYDYWSKDLSSSMENATLTTSVRLSVPRWCCASSSSGACSHNSMGYTQLTRRNLSKRTSMMSSNPLLLRRWILLCRGLTGRRAVVASSYV